ncbi:PepSY domain-containing protein [Enterococcus sp. HY326]|uniref:PepSY domain-containing protein n=1 Tax=Enterococcus sp. HY326 TaxID=2971265 RepID=UPI00224016B4|nr:PepSY domain-containing protein [Enterococcus sp. HY326]
MKKIMFTGVSGLALLFLGACSPNQAQLNQPGPANNTNNAQQTAPASPAAPEASSSAEVAEQTTPSVDTTTSPSVRSGSSADVSTATITLSVSDAIGIFQDQYASTDITELKLKTHHGVYYYEVEGMDDDVEYDIWISATDGSLSNQKQKNLDADERGGIERRQSALNLDNLKNLEEISSIAEGEINSGSAYEWQLERELNTTYWEVHVKTSGRHAEVLVDAQSGQVLEVDYD